MEVLPSGKLATNKYGRKAIDKLEKKRAQSDNELKSNETKRNDHHVSLVMERFDIH
jgi:hypothetical protein